MQKVDRAIKIFPNDDTFRKICVVSKVIAKNSDRKPVNYAFAGFLVPLSAIRHVVFVLNISSSNKRGEFLSPGC